jgi:hypothetical protein
MLIYILIMLNFIILNIIVLKLVYETLFREMSRVPIAFVMLLYLFSTVTWYCLPLINVLLLLLL